VARTRLAGPVAMSAARTVEPIRAGKRRLRAGERSDPLDTTADRTRILPVVRLTAAQGTLAQGDLEATSTSSAMCRVQAVSERQVATQLELELAMGAGRTLRDRCEQSEVLDSVEATHGLLAFLAGKKRVIGPLDSGRPRAFAAGSRE